MAAAGIILIKSFAYRGQDEEWSNLYHFSGAGSDPANWRDMTDALVTLEKTVYSNRVTILRALCYDNTDNDSVYTYDLADYAGVVPGTLSPSLGDVAPGDVAGWVRWDTGTRSSRGKPIYLRKYFHDVMVEAGTNADIIDGTQQVAYLAYGNLMMSEDFAGKSFTGPAGAAPPGPAKASYYATTRTLRKRSKRPTS